MAVEEKKKLYLSRIDGAFWEATRRPWFLDGMCLRLLSTYLALLDCSYGDTEIGSMFNKKTIPTTEAERLRGNFIESNQSNARVSHHESRSKIWLYTHEDQAGALISKTVSIQQFGFFFVGFWQKHYAFSKFRSSEFFPSTFISLNNFFMKQDMTS